MWTWGCLLIVCGACYAPTLTTGAPCDQTIDNCPTGQSCALWTDGEYRCGGAGTAATADAPVGIDAAIDDAIDGPPDAAIDAMLVNHVEYVAVVADCVNPSSPNPDICKTVNGSEQLAIDDRDSMTDNPWIGYIRFDLDGVLAGRTVTSLRLWMVATSDSKAPAPSTGQIWQVAPFTRANLFSAPVPARTGSSPIAPSQGSVSELQVIQWPLPVVLATANGSVYLEIQTNSSDGTNYWNLSGPNPPRLVIDLN